MTGLKVGDVIVVAAGRRCAGPNLLDFHVTKVGRLYFHARESSAGDRWGVGPKFRIDDGDCVDRSHHEAFPSRRNFEIETHRRGRRERMNSLMSCRYNLRPDRLDDFEVEMMITLLEKAAGQTQEPSA